MGKGCETKINNEGHFFSIIPFPLLNAIALRWSDIFLKVAHVTNSSQLHFGLIWLGKINTSTCNNNKMNTFANNGT